MVKCTCSRKKCKKSYDTEANLKRHLSHNARADKAAKTQKTQAQVEPYLKKKMSVEKTASALRLSTDTVSRCFRKLKTRYQKRAKREEWRNYLNEGMSVRDVVEATGVSIKRAKKYSDSLNEKAAQLDDGESPGDIDLIDKINQAIAEVRGEPLKSNLVLSVNGETLIKLKCKCGEENAQKIVLDAKLQDPKFRKGIVIGINFSTVKCKKCNALYNIDIILEEEIPT